MTSLGEWLSHSKNSGMGNFWKRNERFRCFWYWVNVIFYFKFSFNAFLMKEVSHLSFIWNFTSVVNFFFQSAVPEPVIGVNHSATACREFNTCASFFHTLFSFFIAPKESHQSVLVPRDWWGKHAPRESVCLCVSYHLMRRRILTW